MNSDEKLKLFNALKAAINLAEKNPPKIVREREHTYFDESLGINITRIPKSRKSDTNKKFKEDKKQKRKARKRREKRYKKRIGA